MRLPLAAFPAAFLLSACAYDAQPVTMGAFDVYSSYGDKLPGKYLLYVDASAFDIDVKPPDLNCAAYDFPLALSGAFKDSAAQTIGNLVDQLQVVDGPVDRSGLSAQGARGMIIVKGEQGLGRLRVNPGAWSASVSTDVTLEASITVDGRSGRLLGNTVSGDGHGEADLGPFCKGGAASLSDAAQQATKDVLTKLGESFTNSDRLRGAMK